MAEVLNVVFEAIDTVSSRTPSEGYYDAMGAFGQLVTLEKRNVLFTTHEGYVLEMCSSGDEI